MKIRQVTAVLALAVCLCAPVVPACAEEGVSVDTPVPPPAPPPPAPPPPAPMDDQKEAEARWQEINASVQSLKSQIDKKQFAALAGDVEKIRTGIQWMADHPGHLDGDGVASLSGIQSHVREFCDMLNQESAKGNEMTVKLCYRKINEYVQSANTIYHAPPKPKSEPPEKKPAPAPVEKPKAVPAPQASDTAVKATAKPVPTPAIDTKPVKPAAAAGTPATKKKPAAAPASPATKKK